MTTGVQDLSLTKISSPNQEIEVRDNELYATWNTWLEKIKDEITHLAVNRHIFWEVQEIIKANPRIQKPSSFYDWMANLYATDAVIAVRRQLDLDKNSISLARLLTYIKTAPFVLSRERFLALYRHASDPPDIARHYEKLAYRDFDRFAGDVERHVDPKLIAADLFALQEKGKKLRLYATKRKAHFDRSDFTLLPTFHELDECLDFMEELLKKYMLLFTGVAYTRVLPVWQYDWKAIFREAWIPRHPDL